VTEDGDGGVEVEVENIEGKRSDEERTLIQNRVTEVAANQEMIGDEENINLLNVRRQKRESR